MPSVARSSAPAVRSVGAAVGPALDIGPTNLVAQYTHYSSRGNLYRDVATGSGLLADTQVPDLGDCHDEFFANRRDGRKRQTERQCLPLTELGI
jgi:hypothetical protein